jgi:hypothetical protein
MSGIYVASRASIPERAQMWRGFRANGIPIISSWIDEAGEGETENFTDLWDRITEEVIQADHFVLYAEPGDFPLKGALLEAGIAIGAKAVKGYLGRITVCLPGVILEGRTFRPLGSWVKHRLVERDDDIIRVLKDFLLKESR